MDGKGGMFNKLGKRLCMFALSALVMISNAGQQTVPKDNTVQGGKRIKSVSGTIKRRIRKLYDCVMGNDETCTPNEIIITRVIGFCLVATTCRARAKFVERRRLAECREREIEAQREHDRQQREEAVLRRVDEAHRELAAQSRRRYQEAERRREEQRREDERREREAREAQREREFAQRSMQGVSSSAGNLSDPVCVLASTNRFNIWWELRKNSWFFRLPEVLQDQIIDIYVSEPDINEAHAHVASIAYDYFENLNRAAEPPIFRINDGPKEQLKDQWDSWLKAKELPTEVENKCCVCLEDENSELSMNCIPCDNNNQLHSNKVCLDCLSTLVANDNSCPICRASLVFELCD